MIALKNVLVATDFSEPSEVALDYGRHFARTFGATLHVIHVVENVMARFAADAYPVLLPDLQREVEEAGEKQLIGTLENDDFLQLRAIPVVVTATAPAAAIVDYAKTHDIDLLVLGTHGRGAVAKLLMGSVAERVVRTAPCPVLTLHHPEHEFIHPDSLVAVEKA